LSINGGQPPFDYNWSDGQSSQSLSGLNGGTYAVTVTDANDCNTILDTIIQEAPELTATTVSENILCQGKVGTAYVTATGGTTPYDYLWSDGTMTDTADFLSEGMHTVTVTDAAGCTIV